MKTDTEIRTRGVEALRAAMGDVDAERFITVMLRDPFDYTKWQKHLWADTSVEELSRAATRLRGPSAER